MKSILLDSSFIISAAKKKIDIFEELQEFPEIIIPEQVIQEVFNISQSKQSAKNKQSAELALKIIESNKFKKIDLGKGYVDNLIIDYSKKNPETFIATLDREIKNKLKEKIITLFGKQIKKV